MSADAQPNSKQRATEALSPDPPPFLREKAEVGALCVVCGDRACSHLYYGVAACHGCKCFFWRTVKSGLTYSCRYGGECSISTARRNACRYCRFNRCLDSGMKLEAVRMDKKKEKIKRKKFEVDSDEFDENQENIGSPDVKRVRTDNRMFVSSLLLIDKTARDGNGKGAITFPSAFTLDEVVNYPDCLDADRTEMSYKARVLADSALCAEGERRLFVFALDWARQAADMEDALESNDKIALLRACCAPLTLLELGVRSPEAAILALPNKTFIHKDSELPNNCFLNNRSISAVLKWAHRDLQPLELSDKELVLLKALILLNKDAPGLSVSAEKHVEALRARTSSALFQLCCDKADAVTAASRLAQILMLIPQIQLLAVEVREHGKVRNTFFNGSYHGMDPLMRQVYGDIFEENSNDNYLQHSASCSPMEQYVDSS